MNHKKLFLAGVLCLTLLGSAVARAEEESGSAAFWEKTKVTGSIDVNYNYNFNRPANAGGGAVNQYRVFDTNTNTFNVGLMELAIENTPTDWATLRTDLDFGHDTVFYHAAGLGTTEFFDLQQAYVALKAPIGSGLTFKIGKFVTMHGNEVIEAAANSNISRGLLFDYAIPFTHTGIMGSYAFTDWLTLDLGVVNGWNNVVDNNNGKSVHGQFTIKPLENLTWILGGTVGPETAGSDGKVRALIDTTLSYAPTDQWNFAINYDWGRDSGLVGHAGAADWQGLAGYVNWKPFDKFGLSARGEYFRDDVGFAGPTNIALPAVASKHIYEGTLTTHWYLADGLDLRFEFRHDQGNKASFLKNGGTAKKYQDTLASQLVYSF